MEGRFLWGMPERVGPSLPCFFPGIESLESFLWLKEEIMKWIFLLMVAINLGFSKEPSPGPLSVKREIEAGKDHKCTGMDVPKLILGCQVIGDSYPSTETVTL